WCAELRHPRDVAGELPLAVGAGDPQLRVERDYPEASADWVDAVPGRLDGERLLHLRELLWHFGREVVRLGPVFVEGVQLPLVMVGGPLGHAGRSSHGPRIRGPNADAIQPS